MKSKLLTILLISIFSLNVSAKEAKTKKTNATAAGLIVLFCPLCIIPLAEKMAQEDDKSDKPQTEVLAARSLASDKKVEGLKKKKEIKE